MTDQAEIFYQHGEQMEIPFLNGQPGHINVKMPENVAVRVFKNNKCGFAYTSSLKNRDIVIQQAMTALEFGTDAAFTLPGEHPLPPLTTRDKTIDDIDPEFLIHEAGHVIEKIKQKTDSIIYCRTGKSKCTTQLMNTSGLNCKQRHSTYYIAPSLKMPHSAAGINKLKVTSLFSPFEPEAIEEMVSFYRHSQKTTSVPTRKMKVLILEQALDPLIWRFRAACQGETHYQGISPLINMEERQIASENFSYYDHPHIEHFYKSRSFDDEGQATKKIPIIQKGRFKNFIFCTNMAHKCRRKPTGNGYKVTKLFQGTKFSPASHINAPPISNVNTNYIAPGDMPYKEMVKMMDEGIIVHNFIGSHSGNIINGDFSGSVSIGFYIRNGQIKGRAADTMIAGNVYEMFKNIMAIENKLHFGLNAYPRILFNNVSVTGR